MPKLKMNEEGRHIEKRLRVALIYPHDASDVRTWSGTPFFVARAFEEHVGEVIDLSPYTGSITIFKIITHLARKLGRNLPFDHMLSYSRRLGRFFSRKLADGDYDLVLAPGGSEAVAFLETDLPIIMFSDATWELVVDYYRVYSDLIGSVRSSGEKIEGRALDKASLVLHSSHWAEESAIDHYKVPAEKIFVPYIGANFLTPPEREDVLPRHPGERLRLLMVGVHWENKGGPIALRVMEELRARGYDAELTVAGCTVPDDVSHPNLTVVPFLNKQIPEEYARFKALWTEADFFILPSRFEAAGLVFCEASAYGLPILAARTGGIPSIVVEGKNGYTIPHEEEPGGYVDRIIHLWTHPDEYTRLTESARDEYETRLNWGTWGEVVGARVRGMLG